MALQSSSSSSGSTFHVVDLDWITEGTSNRKSASLVNPASVGRGSDNTIQIVHSTVSRRHAEISESSSGVIIKNLSQNAVLNINNTQNIAFNQTGSLSNGDFIMFGTLKVGVRMVEFAAGTVLDATCVTCSRPISSQVDICPWDGTSQSAGVEGQVTGFS